VPYVMTRVTFMTVSDRRPRNLCQVLDALVVDIKFQVGVSAANL
jgi:hypothetical protein